MVDILNPSGAESPAGGEKFSRAQYIRNLTKWNTLWQKLLDWQKGERQLVMANAGYAWGGSNNPWDAGTLNINGNSNAAQQMSVPQPTFATNGSLSGTIKFLETGIYDIFWFVKPDADPGNSVYRINMSGAAWTLADGNDIFGNCNHPAGSKDWESTVICINVRIPTPNLEVRLTGNQANATTNKARIKIFKKGTL